MTGSDINFKIEKFLSHALNVLKVPISIIFICEIMKLQTSSHKQDIILE